LQERGEKDLDFVIWREVDTDELYRFNPNNPVGAFWEKAMFASLPFNTEIGGLATVYPTKEALATKMSVNVDNITRFEIIGDDIYCRMEQEYEIGSLGLWDFSVPGNNICTFYRDLDSKLTSVGQFAFQTMSTLTEFTYGNNVTHIGWGAFEGTGLTTITLKQSIQGLGQSVFKDCLSLTEVIIEEGCELIINPDMVNNPNLSNNIFEGAAMTELIFPRSTTFLPPNYFSELVPNLTTLILPGVTQIGTREAYNATFTGLPNGVTISCNLALETSGLAGIVDEDVQWAIDNKAATVGYPYQ
jgi:hypothetical protein